MVGLKIIWAPSAYQDLKEAYAFIHQDNPRAAGKWVKTILTRVEKLAAFPKMGRLIPEIGLSKYRELLVGDYRIFHEVLPNRLIVLRVLHGSRLFKQ